jgi:hypothetical protein
LGSRTQKSKLCRRWVTHEVLPEIRRTGMYILKRSSEAADSEQLAKRRRVEETEQLQLVLVEMSRKIEALSSPAPWQAQLVAAVAQDLDGKFSSCLEEAKAVLTRIVTEQRVLLVQETTDALTQQRDLLIKEASDALTQQRGQFLGDLLLRFGARFEDLKNALLSPTGSFIKALRQAIRAPGVRQTLDPARYPCDQQASRADVLGCMSLQLALMRALSQPQETALGIMLPPVTLSYGAWKAVRNLFGRRALQLRLQDHEAGLCARPRLWAYGGPSDNSGLRYVFLADEAENCVRRILRQPYQSMIVAEHVRRTIASTAPGEWPANDVDLEPQWHADLGGA